MTILCDKVERFVRFGSAHYEEQFCEIILNLDKWFRRRNRLKIFLSFLALVAFFSADQNHSCNFGWGYYGIHSCEILINDR